MRAEELILVVIDIQEKLIPSIYNRQEVVENGIKLIKLAETFNIPVILTEQYPKGLGRTVEDIEEALKGVSPYRVEKSTFSCVREPSFTDVLSGLRRQGRGKVLLCGIEAHICVYQTAVDLKDMGYKVVFASDATGSRKREHHQIILHQLLAKEVEVLPAESIVFQLLERSGTAEFKKMLQYIK